MKPHSIVCNRCRLVCVKFYLNRCRFTVVIAKCLRGSLFLGHSVVVTDRVSMGGNAIASVHPSVCFHSIFLDLLHVCGSTMACRKLKLKVIRQGQDVVGVISILD